MSEEYDEVSLEIIRQAKARALKILEYSDRTEKQLRDRLKEGEFPPFAVDEAVDYVQKLHYQDDRRYAEIFIRSRGGEKSRYEIENELRLRGVDSGVIEEAIKAGELDEAETVYRAFQKKYARKDLSDPALYQKAFRYFSNRGFRYEDIKEGITRAVSESGEEEGESFT